MSERVGQDCPRGVAVGFSGSALKLERMSAKSRGDINSKSRRNRLIVEEVDLIPNS